MKPRNYILSGLVILGFTALLFYLLLPSPLPSYEGRTLEVWFKKLPPIMPLEGGGYSRLCRITHAGREYGSTNETRQAPLAIQKIGTNGLPFLMGKLRRSESRMITLLEHKAQKAGFRISIGRNAGIERDQAVAALLMLSPLPPASVEELKHLCNDKDQSISIAAVFVLKQNTGSLRYPGSRVWFDL